MTSDREAEARRPKRTPHQKLRDAAQRGTGVRLNAEEVFTLGIMDSAIVTRAQVDDYEAAGNGY